MTLKHTVLVLALIRTALSYKQYKYDELCPGSKLILLSNGRSSGAVVRYKSDYSIISGSCEFTVKLDKLDVSKGIFAYIKKMKLQRSADGSCKDFFQFIYKNGTNSQEICGNVEATVKMNRIRNLFNVESDEVRVKFSIYPANGLEVYLVFIAYSDCEGSSILRCGPKKCIYLDWLNDDLGRHCKDSKEPRFWFTEERKPLAVSYIIKPFLIFVVIVIAIATCFYTKTKPMPISHRTNRDPPVEVLRPYYTPHRHSYAEFQFVRMPLQHQPMPIAIEEPLVSPSPQYDRPMPTSPPADCSDDPPAYDSLFIDDNNPL